MNPLPSFISYTFSSKLNIYKNHQVHRNRGAGGGGGAAAPQSSAKVDLVPIDNNSKKKKGAKKYKPYKIPRKLLVTLLLFT